MPSPSHPVPSVRDCARSCVNPALPAETDAPSRTAADSQTALLPPYPSYPQRMGRSRTHIEGARETTLFWCGWSAPDRSSGSWAWTSSTGGSVKARRVRERGRQLDVHATVRLGRHAARVRELAEPRTIRPHREYLLPERVRADGIAARR